MPDGASPEGSGTNGTDPLALRAQNDNSLAGKLLRVDRVTGNGASDNPGFQPLSPKSPVSRTWVKGFRNPFRLAERPDGTRAFYITDVGWGAWEELNVVPRAFPSLNGGKNYGWPCREGAATSDYTTLFPAACRTHCRTTMTRSSPTTAPAWTTR